MRPRKGSITPGGRATCWRATASLARPSPVTGSFEFKAASGVYTELQCGSYIPTSSWTPIKGRRRGLDGEPTKAFEPSRLVWATVMSRPAEDRAIVNVGVKPLALRFGAAARLRRPPRPTSAPPTSTAGSPLRPPPTGSGLGDKIRLIPFRCGPTVEHLRLVCLRARQPRRASVARSPREVRFINAYVRTYLGRGQTIDAQQSQSLTRRHRAGEPIYAPAG
jgi:hypothetical protein